MRRLVLFVGLLVLLASCGSADHTSKLNGIWQSEKNQSEWTFDMAAGTLVRGDPSLPNVFTATREGDSVVLLQFQRGSLRTDRPIRVRFINDNVIQFGDGDPDPEMLTRKN